MEDAHDDGWVNFVVERDEKLLTLNIRGIEATPFAIDMMMMSEQVYAFADGTLYVTRGMMDFTQSDIELQFVIAHQLAHNIKKHLSRMKRDSLIGKIIAITLIALIPRSSGPFGNNDWNSSKSSNEDWAFSKDFEREADYLAMYLLANAGIPTTDVSEFWRRVNEISGSFYKTIHPPYSERFANLIAIDKEIKAKQEAGEELKPNKFSGTGFASDGNRAGFILGVGPGMGYARNDLTLGTESKFAVKTDFLIGYAPSNRTAITWSNKVLWYDSVGITIASNTSGLGITYFLSEDTHANFISAVIGFNSVFAPFEDNYESSTGFGLGIGVGREVSKNWIIGLDATWGKPASGLTTFGIGVHFSHLWY